MDDSQDPFKNREMLLEIIAGTEELISETRNSRLEIVRAEQEVEAEHNPKNFEDLRYILQREQIRRAYENVEFMLRRLERQKKIAIRKLRELD